MEIDLSKKTRVNLAKEDGSPIKYLFIGTNWGKCTYTGEDDFDVDQTCFVTTDERKVKFPDDILNYNFGESRRDFWPGVNVAKCDPRAHASGVVIYSGDNTDGDDACGVEYNGRHYDEAMVVDTTKFPANRDVITFVNTIYNAQQRKQDFGMIGNARVDIYDMEDTGNHFFYDLSNDDSFEDLTALVTIEVRRTASGFKLVKVGKGYAGGTRELYANFGMEIKGSDY